MTLIKGILLGSAAGIVAVASAQAADLPTRKAAPVEYVKICNVGGITGWTLPGSDTCVKFSGYITAQFTGGNLETAYTQGSWLAPGQTLVTSSASLAQTSALMGGPTAAGAAAASFAAAAGIPLTALSSLGVTSLSQVNQRLLVRNGDTFARNATGWTVRSNFGFDMASNTAYGPLIGHFDINVDMGNGFDNLEGNGNIAYLNTGYLTWAGITAGKQASFYSFTGGGDNWANFASPDQKGFNEPVLLAYTASFGGGFSATIAAQSPGPNGGSGCGTQEGFFNAPTNSGTLNVAAGCTGAGNLDFEGQRWPDFVGALHVKQGWGEAQLSGVIHDVDVRDNYAYGATDCGILGDVACNGAESKTGWGIDAGVKVNLPSFGAGDNFLVTGSYTKNAFWYSGLPDMMWGENGQWNGNGQQWYASDAYFNPANNTWSAPTAWSISGLFEHHFTPQFYIDLEGSYGQVNWSNMGGGCYVYGFGCGAAQFVNGPLSSHVSTWLIGADLGWNPVTNLNFDLELMYADTSQNKPSGFIGTYDGNSGVFSPGAWEGNSSGFAGRFRITRYF